jgi:hypothetical protein
VREPAFADVASHIELHLIADAVELARFVVTPDEVSRLAEALIRAGKPTPYQGDALAQGNSKGLLIGDYLILEKLGQSRPRLPSSPFPPSASLLAPLRLLVYRSRVLWLMLQDVLHDLHLKSQLLLAQTRLAKPYRSNQFKPASLKLLL